MCDLAYCFAPADSLLNYFGFVAFFTSLYQDFNIKITKPFMPTWLSTFWSFYLLPCTHRVTKMSPWKDAARNKGENTSCLLVKYSR